MLTHKSLIIPDSVLALDPFKKQTSPEDPAVREYGSSDVTSDQSTDLSPALSEEPCSPVEDSSFNISPIKMSSRFVPITLERSAEDNINVQMLDLYERLLPTRDSFERRRKFVMKIEAILNSEWQGHDIRAHLFGSSENDLGTSTSDVDICLTTSWPGMQCVRTLAQILKKHGMQRVYTVPRAKVPIVKMWDPVFQLACDMNVNNTLALQNTRMIKTYVAIDPRVRPLAMIIKHWTRQRALNNAADGGTLSTYTWTCMIINFLQMREPPILPVLHQMDHIKSDDNLVINGLDTSFYTDVASLKNFGKRNHESIAGLLFAFFRRFAHEFDYETQVVSVRHGRYLSKREKGWGHLFCVEEPFNVNRNLGNSADDASVYGLRTEFCRAAHILLETANLNLLCAKYFSAFHLLYPPPPPPLPIPAITDTHFVYISSRNNDKPKHVVQQNNQRRAPAEPKKRSKPTTRNNYRPQHQSLVKQQPQQQAWNNCFKGKHSSSRMYAMPRDALYLHHPQVM
ncbi:hypothetical protein BJV82DRAFT_591381 [Fennellomyces sp. T-0311]|nr:hypothetical protein BJV82DRAFT_591381 [Fennellomyces sp. T-0311]